MYLVKRLFICCLLSIIAVALSLQGQKPASRVSERTYNIADSLYLLEEPSVASDDEALRLFLLVASAVQKMPDELRINSLIKAANIHQGYNRYEEANYLYHRAVNEVQQTQGFKGLLYEAYLYLGSSMYFNSVVDSATHYFEQASEIAMNNKEGLYLPELNRLYNSLGAIYYEGANYKQAINYFETAVSFTPSDAPYYDEFYGNIQSNIANCLLKLHLYDSSIRIFNQVKSLNDPSSVVTQNLAHAYVETGAFDSAFTIYKKLVPTTGPAKIVALNDLGRIFMHQGQWKKAETMFDSAISLNKVLTGKLQNKDKAMSYLFLSQLTENLGLLDESISWANEGLEEVHLQFLLKTNFDIPDDVSNTVSPITFYQILFQKANLLFKKYQGDKNEKLLDASLASYLKAIETLHYILKSFDNDEAKVFFIENSKALFDAAIAVTYEACNKNEKYLPDFAYVLESYKGNVLLQNLEHKEVRRNKDIPKDLLGKEAEIKQLYAAYLTKLNQATNEKEAADIKKKLSGLQVELSRLQKSMEKYEGQQWKNRESKLSELAELQNKLDNQTAVLNYYVSGEYIYMLCITGKSTIVKRILADETYYTTFNSFIRQTYQISDGVRYQGYPMAKMLYDYLIKPVEPFISNANRLVIIPDENLFYLPFDALMKSLDKNDFLLNHYVISYHYSASLLLQKKSISSLHSKLDSVLAFAPYTKAITFMASNEPTLPFSDDEVNLGVISKHFSERATKTQFLKTYQGFKYIHLATHATLGADSSNNWIKFYPEKGNTESNKLYIHEIYNMNFYGTDLVTLSACETGGGLSVSGEGLVSLSRAFIYAGANGIVSTLYKTDDLVTAFIMKRMYHHLENGNDVAEALQKSKLDLIESDEINSRLKSPNYWANFVYVGKIQKQTSWSAFKYLFAILLLTGVVGGIFYYKKLKATKP